MQINVRDLDFYFQLNATESEGLIISNCSSATGWASQAGVTRKLGCLKAHNNNPVNDVIYQRKPNEVKSMIVQDEIVKMDRSPWQGDILSDFDWRNVAGVSYVQPSRNQPGCAASAVLATLSMMSSRV